MPFRTPHSLELDNLTDLKRTALWGKDGVSHSSQRTRGKEITSDPTASRRAQMKNYSHPKLTPISVPGCSLHSDLASQDGCAVMPEAAGLFESNCLPWVTFNLIRTFLQPRRPSPGPRQNGTGSCSDWKAA